MIRISQSARLKWVYVVFTTRPGATPKTHAVFASFGLMEKYIENHPRYLVEYTHKRVPLYDHIVKEFETLPREKYPAGRKV